MELNYLYEYENFQYFVYGDDHIKAMKNSLVEGFYRIYSQYKNYVNKIHEGEDYTVQNPKLSEDLYTLVTTPFGECRGIQSKECNKYDWEFVRKLSWIVSSVTSVAKIPRSKLIKFCESYPFRCNDDFWKERYINTYYDIGSADMSLNNWKDRFFEREDRDLKLWKDQEKFFNLLSNSQKIKVLKLYKLIPFENINPITFFRSPILIALTIYLNRPKILSVSPSLSDIINYYNLDLDKNLSQENKIQISKEIQKFYKKVENNDEEFQNMYEKEINKYIVKILKTLNNKTEQETKVPDYVNKQYEEMDKNKSKRGVIFCHGHEHRTPDIPAETDTATKWVLVDINKNTKPDLIGSYNSWDTINELGVGNYDYVISHYCPIAGEPSQSALFIRNMRWLLKSGGKLYLFPGYSVLHNNKDISTKLLKIFSTKYSYLITNNKTPIILTAN
jgi:hypothetical protein